MKLGIIGAPEAKTLVHAKELGLDFVEFDLNPTEFFGRPLDEVVKNQDEIKKAIEETGVEVGAVGRWASHILDENGDVIEAEWSEVKKAIDFGAALGAKHYLCSVAYVPQLSYYKNITAAIKVLNQIVSYAKENGVFRRDVESLAQCFINFPVWLYELYLIRNECAVRIRQEIKRVFHTVKTEFAEV